MKKVLKRFLKYFGEKKEAARFFKTLVSFKTKKKEKQTKRYTSRQKFSHVLKSIIPSESAAQKRFMRTTTKAGL